MNNKVNNANLFAILWKWKWRFVTVFVVAVVLSVIFSSDRFMKPLFKSEAVVYPANLFKVSDESTTEQLLQYMQSTNIRDSIIAKYDLPAHYEISKDYKYYKAALNKAWSNSVTVSRTPYEAVKIEVLDTDPLMAYNICNSIIFYCNKKINELQDARGIETVKIYERQLMEKGLQLDSLKLAYKQLCGDMKLSNMNKSVNSMFNMYDFFKPTYLSLGESQKVYSGESGRDAKSSRGFEMNEIAPNEAYKFGVDASKNFDDFKVLTELIQGYSILYIKYRDELDFAKSKVDKNYSYTNIISPPEIADKKSYPVRWLVVVGITASVMFLFTLLVILLERKKGLKIF